MSWTEIAKTSAVAASPGNSITTASIDTIGADLIIICINSWQAQITPTDSAGNSWTPIQSYSGAGYYEELFYCVNPTTSASHTFTASDVVTQRYPGIAVLAVSGSASSPLDQHNGNVTGGTGDTISPGSITPTEDGELVVVGMSHDDEANSTITSTVDIDYYTWIANTIYGIGTGIGYKVQSTAAAINPTPTWSSSSGGLGATDASFKLFSGANLFVKLASEGGLAGQGGLAGISGGLAG